MADSQAIQGIAPGRVVRAAGHEQLAAALRRCADAGEKVVDYGTLHAGLGLAPPERFVRIDMPGGIVEHHVADMSVKVRAGTTLHDLAAALAPHNQWLPIDGADDSLSIGEVVAHNHYGPLRLGFGAMRDMLLGMTLVNWEGELQHVGGRTVKNVAGYDVTRFMVGHLNMLGVVTELTLRTWAIPEQVTAVALPGVRIDLLDSHVTELLTSDAAPIYLDHQHTPETGQTLHLGYAGSARQCAAQFQALRQWLPAIGYDPRGAGAQRRDGSLWDDARRRALRRAWKLDADAWVKLILPPGTAGETVTELLEADPPARTIIESLPGHGVVHVGGHWSIAEARRFDTTLVEIARNLRGLRLWMRRPEHTLRLDPFTPAPPDAAMLDRIIRAIDPRNLFNPGRLGRPAVQTP